MDDRFGEVGNIDYLQKELHLMAEDIVEKVHQAIERKNR